MNLDLLNLVITELNKDIKSKEPAEYMIGKLLGIVYYEAMSSVANFLAGIADMGELLGVAEVEDTDDLNSPGISGYYSEEEEAWKMDVMDATLLTLDVFYDLISSVEMEVPGTYLDDVIITHPLSASEFCEVCQAEGVLKLKHLTYKLVHSEDESLKVHRLTKHS